MRPTSNRSIPLPRKLAKFARLLRTGLLGRFVLVLGAVGLIPLIIVPWLVQLTRDSVTEQILTTHSVAARTTAARVDAWIRSLRISAQTLSSNPFLLQATRNEVGEIIAGLLQADPAIKGAVVVNATGVEVGSAILRDFSEVVRPALLGPTAAPVSVIPGDRIWIRVATSLDEGKGELRIMVDGSGLAEILKSEEIGRDAIIGLFDADELLIASLNVSEDTARFPKALLKAGAARATSGASRYDDTDPVLAGAHSPVQAAPWFVASIQPATRAEAVASEMRRKGLLALLGAVALTGLFSTLGYFAVIRPIDEIAKSQWKVAKRRGHAQSAGGNEIALLKEAFITMRRQTLDREAIGKIFLSRYLVLDILGTGGMGSVFRGWDPKLERPVAIKTIHMGGENRATVDAIEQRQILLREAVTVAKFNHPNIVAIYDVEDADEAAFLAMEFVDGLSLESLLAEAGLMRVELAVPLIAQIARALEAAHSAGVIHCDIKPANILLGKDGAIKVTDFGIARSAIRNISGTSGTFGTPGYLPPEALISAAFTPTADLFGVGAVFYETLTGTPPHAGKNAQETLLKTATQAAISVREHNKSIPPAVDDLILGLLQKEPSRRRPTSARELAESLEGIAARNDWKWVAPEILAGRAAAAQAEVPTAAISAPTKLG
ncbi:MAG: serine/threonine protein kinase [Vicinamibacteria bacterium]|nr:serine/threonine protein kinase [Vicinamibacteria bacterium]